MDYRLGPSVDEDELAIVQKGNVATRAIGKGNYVWWNGRMRKAKAAILQSQALSESLFNVTSDGVLNDLSKYAIVASTGTIAKDSATTLSWPEGFTHDNCIIVSKWLFNDTHKFYTKEVDVLENDDNITIWNHGSGAFGVGVMLMKV